MRLEKMYINNFRSIEDIEIIFPKDKPVVLFGPNNAGKSNILKAIDYFLGERYPTYIEFQDSDYFLRDKEQCPNISFTAFFDDFIYSGKYKSPATKNICFTTNKSIDGKSENAIHYYNENSDRKIFLSNDDREKCQFILIDATRDIGRQLSYFSQYSVLSKMAKKMHTVMHDQVKDKLDNHFSNIKSTFESVPEYKEFYGRLQSAFQSNIDGFEHKLEIDLSAYDPNNYFHSLKILAKEGDDIRSFTEFGTGEQQILLMSFIKAYAETFKGENFILGIEEPEAHLHPIAQKWLSINLSSIAKSGIQVVITTHSPEFLDIENLEGFVKVYREGKITRIKQHTSETLAESCIDLKAHPTKTKSDSILPFYKAKTFYDQLRGFFGRKILLVEGETEFFALPNYFKNCGYDLVRNGIEIVNCRGKSQITRNYRLFSSFGYKCFCIFDADKKSGQNADFSNTFGFNEAAMCLDNKEFKYDLEKGYGYFGKDFESYMRSNIDHYSFEEDRTDGDKPLKAKVISETRSDFKPEFIEKIAEYLKIEKLASNHHPNPKGETDPQRILKPL